MEYFIVFFMFFVGVTTLFNRQQPELTINDAMKEFNSCLQSCHEMIGLAKEKQNLGSTDNNLNNMRIGDYNAQDIQIAAMQTEESTTEEPTTEEPTTEEPTTEEPTTEETTTEETTKQTEKTTTQNLYGYFGQRNDNAAPIPNYMFSIL